ncbi:Flp pilus assembly protein CpaB [Microvirga sp. GCM10011540]|uniref:Flp pilus assembly protein CpaB n=1 Tax=Microvirga sp. GCM10011540 TaxID=3317338 RepID=UPI00360F1B9C
MLRIIILFIAISAGSLAAWLALSIQPGGAAPTAATQAPEVQQDEILVASGDLAQGQALDETKLRWQPWPQGALNPGYVSRRARPDALAFFKGAVVRNHFVSGEPIREEKLARGSSGLLATLLPPGKRAVAIRVSAESTAGGFVLPNDRVDIIQTINRQANGQNDNLSRTLLRNIRVLAVDQKADETKNDAVVIGKTVTLELSPSQTEVIAAGQATGSLSLALRSVADADEEPITNLETTKTVRILRAGRSEIVRIQ